MWLPNTDPSGSGLILNTRFKGQEAAAADAPAHAHLGILGVVGFLMKDLAANPPRVLLLEVAAIDLLGQHLGQAPARELGGAVDALGVVTVGAPEDAG